MPNFDPNTIVAQITDLAARVETLEGAIAGTNSVTVTEGCRAWGRVLINQGNRPDIIRTVRSAGYALDLV